MGVTLETERDDGWYPSSDARRPVSGVRYRCVDEKGHYLAFARDVRTRLEILAFSSRDVSVEEVVSCFVSFTSSVTRRNAPLLGDRMKPVAPGGPLRG